MITCLMTGMIFLTIGFSLRIVVKDSLHPSVVFSSVWGAVLLVIGLAEPFGYFQIGLEALLVILIGVGSFISGSLLQVNKKISFSKEIDTQINYKKISVFCILLHTVMLPISFFEVSAITQNADDIYASAYRLREASVSGEESVGFMVGNYLTLGLFFVPLLLLGWLQKRVSVFTLLLISFPWVIVNVYINGRSGVVTLLLCCVYIYLIKGNKISYKVVGSFFAFFALIIVAGNLLVSKIDAKLDEGVFTVLSQSIESFSNYLMQGPILFSEYIKNPVAINPTWDALVFPCQILAKLNMCVSPTQHQDYMSFSSSGDFGNVYSVFFSMYPKYGWIGVIAFSALYGFWSAFNHVRTSKSLLNLLLGGFLFSATVLSVFSDAYGMNLYFFAKILVIYLIAKNVFSNKKSSSSHARGGGSEYTVSMAAISK